MTDGKNCIDLGDWLSAEADNYIARLVCGRRPWMRKLNPNDATDQTYASSLPIERKCVFDFWEAWNLVRNRLWKMFLGGLRRHDGLPVVLLRAMKGGNDRIEWAKEAAVSGVEKDSYRRYIRGKITQEINARRDEQ